MPYLAGTSRQLQPALRTYRVTVEQSAEVTSGSADVRLYLRGISGLLPRNHSQFPTNP